MIEYLGFRVSCVDDLRSNSKVIYASLARFRVGLKVEGLGFKVESLGILDLGFKVESLGISGLGFRD